jgi:hypothetical protein
VVRNCELLKPTETTARELYYEGASFRDLREDERDEWEECAFFATR